MDGGGEDGRDFGSMAQGPSGFQHEQPKASNSGRCARTKNRSSFQRSQRQLFDSQHGTSGGTASARNRCDSSNWYPQASGTTRRPCVARIQRRTNQRVDTSHLNIFRPGRYAAAGFMEIVTDPRRIVRGDAPPRCAVPLRRGDALPRPPSQTIGAMRQPPAQRVTPSDAVARKSRDSPKRRDQNLSDILRLALR